MTGDMFPTWVVFDGLWTIIDGPYATAEEAETAADSHRYSDPDLNTVVCETVECGCGDRGCCDQTGGRIVIAERDWHWSNHEAA